MTFLLGLFIGLIGGLFSGALLSIFLILNFQNGEWVEEDRLNRESNKLNADE